MSGVAATAAWTSPALLVVLAAQIGSGAADSPLLVLVAVVAPLVALLRRGTPEPFPGGAAAVLTVVVAGLLLWANLLVFAEAAALLGGAPWHGGVVGGGVVVASTVRRPRAPGRAMLIAVGVGLIVLPLAALASRSGTAPWMAWTANASRMAPTLGERSLWVTRGERFPRGTVLDFTEGHRITALTPGTYHVVERDGVQAMVREWQLDAGESLTLRPGDRLGVHAGARIRFEVGKRVPGAALSGVDAVAPRERQHAERLLTWAGAVVTLVGGACVLVRPAHRIRGGAVAAPALVVTAVLGAGAWGVYGAMLAPELIASGSLAATIVTLPAAVAGGAGGRALGLLACAGLLALLAATGCDLRARVVDAAGDRGVGLWIALVALASSLAVVPADPWPVLAAGLGLAASAGAAPLVARGTRAARTAGSVTGAAVFGGLVLAAPATSGALGTLVAWPALVAAPVGWGVATLADRARIRAR